MISILFYAGIAVILFLCGRNVYQAWRRDRESEEWMLKHWDGDA